MSYTRERLGEILLAAGRISEEQLAGALAAQQVEGGKLGQVLVRHLIVEEDVIARTLAEQKGLEHVSLAGLDIDRAAASEIPERMARRSLVIPISYREDSLVVAMADPLDIAALDDVRMHTGRPIVPVVATGAQILYAIEKYITSADAFEDLVLSVETDEVDTTAVSGDEDVPIVRLVNQLIREAVFEDASDIHIEPTDTVVRVRLRVDGVLREVMRVPASARAGLISRIKVMAEMDIAERRRPQDGRIALIVEDRAVDMRVATLPTPFGESIVIRILNHDAVHHTLADLGMTGRELELYEGFLRRPYGEILISGPTGSGKTTTLYAGMSVLNEPSRKIITIEDPIEYRMPGVTQMAVHPAIGLTFAQLLRTVLRSDPDVVMVGEIRDPETAEIATRAALTGHLVLSSIHTNDAPSAINRLVDMDVAPYVASSALVGVVAQRLVRRLCVKCRKKVRSCDAAFAEAGVDPAEYPGRARLHIANPKGCDECGHTGYRGRIGLFEIMEVDDEIRRLFLSSASTDQIRAAAISAGMKTLRADALEKVIEGITSLEEMRRVVV